MTVKVKKHSKKKYKLLWCLEHTMKKTFAELQNDKTNAEGETSRPFVFICKNGYRHERSIKKPKTHFQNVSRSFG